MMAVLAVGALIGYVAAWSRQNTFQSVGAAPPSAENGTGKPADAGSAAVAPCCPEGASTGQLLARADAHTLAAAKVQTAAAKAQSNGKKPNVVFIMGDDVGWFNIGAYHR